MCGLQASALKGVDAARRSVPSLLQARELCNPRPSVCLVRVLDGTKLTGIRLPARDNRQLHADNACLFVCLFAQRSSLFVCLRVH